MGLNGAFRAAFWCDSHFSGALYPSFRQGKQNNNALQYFRDEAGTTTGDTINFAASNYSSIYRDDTSVIPLSRKCVYLIRY